MYFEDKIHRFTIFLKLKELLNGECYHNDGYRTKNRVCLITWFLSLIYDLRETVEFLYSFYNIV